MDPEYIKSRPVVDMNSCVPGQKLITNRGTVWIYRGRSSCIYYPHVIATIGCCETRTNEGWAYLENILYTDEDVVYIVPVDGVVK